MFISPHLMRAIFFRQLARNRIPVLLMQIYEPLTRDIRDDSDIKNTASQMKDGAKILQKSVMCSFNGENFSKKMYFLRFFASS